MVFRRPRINVKPNVQVNRPSTTAPQTSEPSNETNEIVQEEKSISSADNTVTPPTVCEETLPSTEDSIKTSMEPPIPPAPPSPIVDVSEANINEPTTEAPVNVSIPTTSTSLPTTTNTVVRPIIRRRIAPNIAGRIALHHRRPSASCSGTESESEPSRQRHTTTSSISFTRVIPEVTKTVTFSEPLVGPLTSNPMNVEETLDSTTGSVEALVSESQSMQISSIPIGPLQIQSSTTVRSNSKITRENISLHIAYRAQRLASKVEPEKTIRKRRAMTLGKIDKNNPNKDGPIDTSKLTLADFVHYNPVDNPMEPKPKSTTTVENNNDPVRKQTPSTFEEPKAMFAPQLKLDANGSLVLDEESLYIQNLEETPRNTVIIEGNFNDDNLTHRSYRKIGRRKRWNNRDTLRFYQALRMCGTDFTLIANVFPNRDRNDIKRKFKTEDKANRTMVDSALSQRIPFDLTCFYSPSEGSSEDENLSDTADTNQNKKVKRRKMRHKKSSSEDPLEINIRREKRLQAKKNSMKPKKSAEFIDDDDDDDDVDDDDDQSIDVADTVEVITSGIESKCEDSNPSTQNEANNDGNSTENMADLENLLGQMNGSHLLFVHNTDETTGLDRIDVHVVVPNETNEQ